VVSAPARRELVRHMLSHGLSERRCLRVVGMNAGAYRYEPAQDRNCAHKEKIYALERLTAANEVWSMNFVFNRTAEGRSINNLTVGDDATHEGVAIVPERAVGRNQLMRILEQLSITRGLSKAIRTDNGKEFCSRAMLIWAQARGDQLFLIEPGTPN
jgi:putative transposase